MAGRGEGPGRRAALLRLDRFGASPCHWAAALVLAGLAALVAASPHRLIFDERYYMQASQLLAADFDFVRLMTTPLDVAAGPLYAYLHAFAAPLTGLQAPAIRAVNLACLLAAIWATAATLRRLACDAPFARAAMLLAVPMIGPTSGLALTELPALALASFAVLAVAEAMAGPAGQRSWLLLALAGLCAGLAILGRQTYLPGLAGFAAIALGRPQMRWQALLGLAAGLATIAPMIALWGGIAPPWQPQLSAGLRPEHGVLAFVYLAVAAVLIAPGFALSALATGRRRIVAALAVAAAMAGALLAGFDFVVASRVVAAAPSRLQPLLQAGLNGAMVGIAAVMVVATLANMWDRRADRVFLLLGCLTILLNGTAAGIGHQFSSRYVLTAFPFALLLLQPWMRPGIWAAGRMLLGALLGFASLSAYYWNEAAPIANEQQLAPTAIPATMLRAAAAAAAAGPGQ